MKFSDIQDAFFFVSSAGYGLHSAVLCKNTGELFYRSEMADLDEQKDKELDGEQFVEIPHKNDLGLGQDLVFDFVEMHTPHDYERVRQIFRKRGAYGRFKDFLDSKGLLQKWYDFEAQREEEELRKWCVENEIELSG